MNLIFRILELVKWLEWALDLIDLYDQHLTAIDGPEVVYSKEHVKAKEEARRLVEEYKNMPGYSEMRQ